MSLLVRPLFPSYTHVLNGLVIPNNTSMSPVRDGMMKLISGPNGSGKSVYVKQVGLIVLLAHIGSYVPAGASNLASFVTHE